LKNLINKIPKSINLPNLFNAAIENSQNIIFITDINGNIEYVNKKFTEITGYKFAEVIGKTPKILNSGKHNSVFFKEMWTEILSGRSWVGEVLNKDKNGYFFWDTTTISPIKSDDGEITNFLAIKRNITNEKNIEKKLFYNIETFRNVFDFINDTVTIHDFSGKMLAVNKAFCKRLGYTYEEAMQLKPKDFDANEN